MIIKRGRGRPPKPKPVTVAEPHGVFLTREQLAERWHCSTQTITRNYKRLGVRKVVINGRWLAALSQIEELEKKRKEACGG